MSDASRSGAVIFAKQLAPMARFYETLLGLRVVTAEPDHVVLESAALQLVIHAIPKHIADTFTIASPPEVREETPIKLFLPVASIDAARAAAPGLGGRLWPKEREWVARGFRACDAVDPEGNVLQVREVAA
jgi:predicted enzyme related to lactoylglutathione lyase